MASQHNSGLRFLEPDAPRIDPCEDFVLAWLRQWRSIGNDVARGMNDRPALMMAEYHPEGFPLAADQPPHLCIRNSDEQRGATKALETLLDSVPGARATLRTLVSERR